MRTFAWRGHRRDDDEERRRRDVPALDLVPGERAGRSPRPRTASATRAAGRARWRAARPRRRRAEGRHPARRAPSQPTTSRSAANSGARPVKCEYSIHASGIHAAIASGRSTSTSAAKTHAPVEHDAELDVVRQQPAGHHRDEERAAGHETLRHGAPGEGSGVRAGGQAPGHGLRHVEPSIAPRGAVAGIVVRRWAVGRGETAARALERTRAGRRPGPDPDVAGGARPGLPPHRSSGRRGARRAAVERDGGRLRRAAALPRRATWTSSPATSCPRRSRRGGAAAWR